MTSSFVLTLAYIWAVLRAFFSALRAYADITFSALYPTIVVPYSDMRGKRCLVTGSNIGLGKEIALGLAGMGAEIHLVCRDRAKAVSAREEIIKRTGNKKVYLETIDVSSFASIRAFVQRWSSRSDSDRRIDVFISNAGVATSCKVTTGDGLELCYQVNTLSHVAVITQLLQRNCFASDARIIMTSSAGIYSSKVMHPEDVNSPDLLGGRVEGWKPWNPLAIFWLIWTLSARSKAQQVIFANELQKRLATIPRYQGITVSTFHPGKFPNTTLPQPARHFHLIHPVSIRPCPDFDIRAANQFRIKS
ncbi:hypothetical protein FRC03_009738 [Tulasnella sp. 419]|nr:hypothetical protein FRC03_009738 [Tulasnella sp. 419]